MNYRNLAQILREQAEQRGPSMALRYRRHGIFQDLNWSEYRERALACAAALVEAGIRPGERVAVLAENRVEWLLADMGILTAAAVNVSPHAPLTAKQVHFQLEDSVTRWVFASTREQLEKIAQVRNDLPALLGVVVFDPIDHNLLTSLNAISWDGFLQRGRRTLSAQSQEILDREAALRPDDLATIMYTSGTTGNPKGVMLTQENLVSNAEATLQLSPHKPDDIVLTWLPFSHIYARTVDHYQSLVAGVVLCLSESAESVAEDLSEIRPTHMSSVPRLYEKVLTALASPDKAQTRKKLREFFGEQIQWLSSGGAPLPRPITDAYQEAGLPLYQGYGLTETSPVITFNRPGRNKLGTVGQPIPGVEVRVASDGEVLSRGPHIMKGYWNNPPATAESIVDGWFHTGDLGRIDAEGYLSITGRKKELLVLSNGKKVVPSFIEGLLVGDECIDQAAIAGEGRNYLTALIVPHWENLRKLLATEQPVLASLDAKNLATHPVTERVLHRRIGAALSDVASWEQVKKFVVLVAPFTLAAEELTVSLKLRRSVVLAHYADELERLYKSP